MKRTLSLILLLSLLITSVTYASPESPNSEVQQIESKINTYEFMQNICTYLIIRLLDHSNEYSKEKLINDLKMFVVKWHEVQEKIDALKAQKAELEAQ